MNIYHKYLKLNNIFLFLAGYGVLTYIPLSEAALALPDPAEIPRPQPTLPVPSKLPDIKSQEKPAYRPTAEEKDIKIIVERFIFTGNKVFSNEHLSGLTKDFTGHEIGLKELNQATSLITDYYRKRGYFLAQAYLPAQDIKNAAVEIAVLEGKLGQMKLGDNEKLDEEYLKKMATYRIRPGDTMSENNLVRNITLLNALPGIKASAQLNPGEAVGSSDVEIDLQPLPTFEGDIGVNTYGNRFTNREVAYASARWNNPAGIGDQLYLNVKSARDEGQRGLSFGYLTPVHESGTMLSLGYNFVDYKLGGQFKQLDASGDSQYFTFSLDQPILRNARYGVTARLGGAYKLVDDEVSAFTLNNRRSVSNIDLGIYGDWLNNSADVSYQVGLNLQGGHVHFKNDFAKTLDDSGAKSKGNFLKYNLMASRTQYFNNGFVLALRADYQDANRNLDSVEKMSIGGISRWRAFAELPSLADTGFMAGAELRKNITAGPKMANFLLEGLSPYGFVDFGRGKINQKTLSDDNHVKSTHYGIGIDAAFKKKWLLGLTVSHQRRDIDGAKAENETRLWSQIEKDF